MIRFVLAAALLIALAAPAGAPASAPPEPPCEVTGEDTIKDEICAEEIAEWEAWRAEDRRRERREEREIAAEERHEKELRHEHSRRAPTVRKPIAEEMLLRRLHRVRLWRQRSYGFIDCNGGRVNRTHWRCRFGLVAGAYCIVGRAMISGAWFNPNEGNRPWYETRWGSRACPD